MRSIQYIALALISLFYVSLAHLTRTFAEGTECIPSCRSAYICHQGECISKCNPPCGEGERCGDDGECFEPGATPDVPPAPQATPPTPPPPPKSLRERAERHTGELRDPPPEAAPAEERAQSFEAKKKTREEPLKTSTRVESDEDDDEDEDEDEDERNYNGLSAWITGGATIGISLPSSIVLPHDLGVIESPKSFILRGFVDRKIHPDFSSGVYMSLISSEVSGLLDFDMKERDQVFLFNTGINVKWRKQLNIDSELRIGCGLGVNVHGITLSPPREESRPLGSIDVSPLIEGTIKINKYVKAIGSLTLTSQLAALDDEPMVWRPIISASTGIEFY